MSRNCPRTVLCRRVGCPVAGRETKPWIKTGCPGLFFAPCVEVRCQLFVRLSRQPNVAWAKPITRADSWYALDKCLFVSAVIVRARTVIICIIFLACKRSLSFQSPRLISLPTDMLHLARRLQRAVVACQHYRPSIYVRYVGIPPTFLLKYDA